MSDNLSTDLTPAPTPEVSTQIDDPRATDPGQSQHREQAAEPEKKQPESRLDAIKRAAEDVEKANADDTEKDGDEKPKTEEKPKEAEVQEEKPAKEERKEPHGDRRHPDVPKNFSPAAKEKWLNVPYDVKIEFERALKDHEAEIGKHTEASQRYESIREFDDLARQNGRELRESLTKLNEIENLMASNPLAGLNAILMEIGPRKADGQPVSLYEVAQHIAQAGPQGYQQMMQQGARQPQEPQSNREVEELRSQMQAMQQQQVASAIIDPFRAANPRYDELQDDIAFFLESGKIPSNLSPYDRLSQAYDMAVRINPTSHVEQRDPEQRPDPESRAGSNFGGSTSVKGAPATGVDVSARSRSKMSRQEAIRAAMADAGLTH